MPSVFCLSVSFLFVCLFHAHLFASFQKDMFGKSNICPEGASSNTFSPENTCKEVVDKYIGGLQSAISYLGIRSSIEMDPDNITFIKVTQSSYKEGTPHGCS